MTANTINRHLAICAGRLADSIQACTGETTYLGRVVAIVAIVVIAAGWCSAEICGRTAHATDTSLARFTACSAADTGRSTACAPNTGFFLLATIRGTADVIARTTLTLLWTGGDASRVALAAIIAIVRLRAFVGAIISFLCGSNMSVCPIPTVLSKYLRSLCLPSAAKGLTNASLV